MSDVSLGVLDDIDGDDAGDYYIAARGGAPLVHLYSGRSGEEIRSIGDSLDDDLVFRAITPVGDVDRDGFPEVVIAGSLGSDAGVWVLSTRAGDLVYTLRWPGVVSPLSTAAVGDLDGDGHSDWAVSMGTRDDAKGRRGLVVVVSGKSGEPLAEIEIPRD